MSELEMFRDSRSAEAEPCRTLAAASAVAATVTTAAASAGLLANKDLVFPLVLALYAQQQRWRRQREEELGCASNKSTAVAVGAAAVISGGLVVGDDGDDDGDRGDGGFSARGVAAAVADGAAAVCGDWKGEAKALVRELRDVSRDFPSEVEFYLPQLCIVVALGDFVRPAPLVEFLLELCGSDLRLAHKTHWFLKSFCAGSSGSPLGLSGLSSFAQRVQKRGCAVASRLSRALNRQSKAAAAAAVAVPLCDGRGDHGTTASSSTAAEISGKTLASAEAKVATVVGVATTAACGSGGGGEASEAAVAGYPSANEVGQYRGTESEDETTAASAVMVAAAVVVEDEEEACSRGVRRVWQGDSSQSDSTGAMGVRRWRQLDVDEEEEDDSLAEHYDPAMFFVEALLGLAEQLGELPPTQRAKGLQEGLERINEFFLSERAQGSDVIYMPFRGSFHQICAIHPRESMHFSTKERVPLLVCLEVKEVQLPRSLTTLVRVGSRMSTASTSGSSSSSDSSNASVGSSAGTGSGALTSLGGGGCCGGGGSDGVGQTAGAGRRRRRGKSTIPGWGEREAGAQVGPMDAEHAGEAGLMDRFRGTVHSFVKLQNDDDFTGGDGGGRSRGHGGDAVAASLPVHLPTHRHLRDSIEGDECSSRTASEADLSYSNSNPRLSSPSTAAAAGRGGGGGGRGADDELGSFSPIPSPTKSRLNVSGFPRVDTTTGSGDSRDGTAFSPATPASPVPTASSMAALAGAAAAARASSVVLADGGAGTPAAYCSNPEESDFGDDERRAGGEGGGEGGDGAGGFEGEGSQGGFWYGEGGGASALEAAMGQWGDDSDSVEDDGADAAVSGGGNDDDNDDDGSDATASTVGKLIQGSSAHNIIFSAAVPDLAAEDESWEIVQPPAQWDAEAAAACAAATVASAPGGGGGADNQTDSYSEYLAAMEAERLDRQLEAEAEEEEAKRDAAGLLQSRVGSGGGVESIEGVVTENVGSTSTSTCTSSIAKRRAGRHYFAPAVIDGGDDGVGGDGGNRGGRRRRLAEVGGVEPGYVDARLVQEQPRIIFKEQWREKEARVWQERGAAAGHGGFHGGFRARSARDDDPDGGPVADAGGGAVPTKGWKLLPIIVKANDDLRQEQFVGHLISVFDEIFKAANLGARLRPYEIMATSPTAGVIEAVPDTVSLDALKRHTPHLALHEFFRRHFGRRGMLRQARANFVESCAAYSVVCYLLQIKDRHNGNLLLSAEGHLIHIDWGFALELSPGGNLGFESAPFKLTQEFVEVMGGVRSTSFQKYRSLCVRTFLQARRSRDKIIALVEMMVDFRPDLACFGGRPKAVLKHLRARFQPDKSAQKCVAFVHDLIEQSVDNWRTKLYDAWQRRLMGIQ